ncbi:MAG: 3-deoxy-D-manno-octulosonic acid transferase [Salinivirgaceae bacterium]|nr:3-deoxy-D-manno-octulosonic acid transferase [Salinivirgaceae bacterium]
MILIYNFTLFLYSILVKFASLFNPKAKQWVEGRKNIFARIHKSLENNEDIAWFHVSSLGEFEQGRPVIEGFREKYPNFKIFLTFFSPSGYEIRKNYEGADYIFYLPVDSKRNAKKLIQLINPKVAFFVKYEFWFHYLNELNKNNIPTYIFSAIFREKQLFFKWYGGWYRKLLKCFTHLYVQNEQSKKLLAKLELNNVTVGGDTRFDRVFDLAKNAKPIELIEQFTKNSTTIICGSTWEKDEELIAQYALDNSKNLKWIIAPHEIHESHIAKIVSLFKLPLLKFSEANTENINDVTILLINNIGILSSLYRYGSLAYIGGGFGVGIHNTLEAATFGLPVVFGPHYKRFQEACDLIEISAGFSIENYTNFVATFNSLLENDDLRKKSSDLAHNYVNKMRGGTKIILNELKL